MRCRAAVPAGFEALQTQLAAHSPVPHSYMLISPSLYLLTAWTDPLPSGLPQRQGLARAPLPAAIAFSGHSFPNPIPYQSQACRNVKFSPAPLDLLAFAEHRSRCHLVDCRMWDRQQVRQCWSSCCSQSAMWLINGTKHVIMSRFTGAGRGRPGLRARHFRRRVLALRPAALRGHRGRPGRYSKAG